MWLDEAACFGMDVNIFVPASTQEYAYARAKRVCASCPVALACLEDALRVERGHVRHGVRGGLGPHERLELERARRRG